MNCQYCGKTFSSGYNLRRHENDYCPSREYNDDFEGEPDEETSGSSYDEGKSDEETSGSSYDENNTEDGGDTEEEIDPWATMIDDAKETVRPEYDEQLKMLQMDGEEESAAKQEAFEKVLPDLQKEFADVYVDNLRWMKALKKDPIHKKIMETKEAFVNDDSFDPDEALTAAVDKRKFLLNQLLLDQGHFSDSDDD